MGQNLAAAKQNAKGELLLRQVDINGDVETIKSLCRHGANLEYIDRDGKTPLIAACMNSESLSIARTLIELGANINAYRPGRHAGTPLHHAAKRGLEQTVNLLLSHGANVLVRNDDCQTPLDVARVKGFTNVVRTIENHISYFSCWLVEYHGPEFLGAFASQLVSRKIWAVVIPCGSSNPSKPLRLELAIYNSLQDARPRTAIALWKAKIEELKLQQSHPVLVILDQPTKTRYKLGPASEDDKQKLQLLYNACRGIPQGASVLVHEQTVSEATELAMAQSPRVPSSSPRANGWEDLVGNDRPDSSSVISAQPAASSSRWADDPTKDEYNGWNDLAPELNVNTTRCEPKDKVPSSKTTTAVPMSYSTTPSAPPLPEESLDGPINYPSIDQSILDMPVPETGSGSSTAGNVKGEGSSSCVICWEAPVEGACIPCGHMAGCMSCLTEIKAKKGVCPVCRAKIKQVVRIYAV